MKSKVFAIRTWKEIMRDPLSYIFCLGFPLVMLVIMSIIDKSIPAEAEMQVFRIRNLAPGITYFGLTFVMLFTSIQVSKDRTTALLLRLYASPMKPVEYIFGYTMPVVVLAVVQMVICFTVSFVIGMCTGDSLGVTEILLSMVALFPSVVLFVGLGILFGTLVNEKAAPGLCSILISAAGMIGGIWMDIDGLGGAIYINSTKAVIDNNEFYLNTARNGSAIYYDKYGTKLKLTGNTFDKNQAWVYRLPIFAEDIYYGESEDISSTIYGGNNIAKYNDLAVSNAIYNAAISQNIEIDGESGIVTCWEI